MKKVFIISQWGWAPRINAQIIRLVSLIKHLPENGWETVVFARKASEGEFIDRSFKRGSEKIYHYPGFLPYRHRMNRLLQAFFTPDVFMPDLLLHMRTMEKIVRKEKPDVIFTSTPPSGLIAGAILSKRTGIPLVIDYADPWTTSKTFRPISGLHRSFGENIERRVINTARAICVASPRHINDLSEKFGNIEKYQWLPNGYDGKLFSKSKKNYNCKKTIFMYGGSVYADFDLTFIEIFREIYDTDFQNRFILKFIGNTDPKKEYITKQGKGFTDMTGPVPRETYIEGLMSSNVLVFARGEKYDDFMSSRVLEFMGSLKPIMAFVKSDSLIEDIFRKSGNAFIFDKDDEERAKEFIIKAIEDGIKVRPNMEYIESFEWKNISRDLSNILEGVLE